MVARNVDIWSQAALGTGRPRAQRARIPLRRTLRGHIVLRGGCRYGHLQLDEPAGRSRATPSGARPRDDASTTWKQRGRHRRGCRDRRRPQGRGRLPEGKEDGVYRRLDAAAELEGRGARGVAEARLACVVAKEYPIRGSCGRREHCSRLLLMCCHVVPASGAARQAARRRAHGKRRGVVRSTGRPERSRCAAPAAPVCSRSGF